MTASERLAIDCGSVTLVGERWRGPGPAVVLLHSGVTDRRSWHEVVVRLAATHDVVAYDRRGYGETAASPDDFHDVDDLAQVLRALFDEPVWLVGNSMGGGVALDAALRHPPAVAGLVLIGTAVTGAPEIDDAELDEPTAALAARMDEAQAAGDIDEAARVAAWLWLDGPRESEGRVHGAPRALMREMCATALSAPETRGKPDGPAAWSVLERIDTPTLIACGALDVTQFISRSQEIARRLPHATFQLLPGTAHLPMLDEPAAVADLIVQAMRGYPSAA